MSVYYQTSPIVSPPRTYYPVASSQYSQRSFDYGYPQLYNNYTIPQSSPYNYYSPPTYYPSGSQVLTVSQQPRFTAPMIYTYTLPHRSHRSHRMIIEGGPVMVSDTDTITKAADAVVTVIQDTIAEEMVVVRVVNIFYSVFGDVIIIIY
ncbi:hypothetical protein PNOK_0888500 [Pyrrhoderma noxium]|uniref:Uncharacterized protein n=1 Tax=Pyrrhoderma noxium TaxID=2282107 RepID=A0A286U6E2_9AGAM|nr:hypothetical protein PNOK_0888500 [Pyrrhoderma noxium]